MTTLNFPQILQAATETPWAIRPKELGNIHRFLVAKAQDHHVEPQAFGLSLGGNRRAALTVGSARVIPVHGPISHRASAIGEYLGWASTESLAGQLDRALADSAVRTIVLDIDSPGGAVAGMPELAAQIRDARSEKRIVAVANSTAASAAYCLGAQASEFVVTPSGVVGSVGVVAMHADHSKFLEDAGVSVSLITSVEHKAEENPFEPLSDEAREAIQARVDAAHRQFVADVAKGRGVKASVVNEQFGKGRIVLAHDAVAAGMVDRVATISDVLRRVTRAGKQGRSMSANSSAVEALDALAASFRGAQER